MELKNYQQYLDELFNDGNLWKHRTLRTVLDEGSAEWNATTIKQKAEILNKIYEAEENNIDNYFSLINILREYRTFYLEERKAHVANNLLPTLACLIQNMKNKKLISELAYIDNHDFENPQDKQILKTSDPVITMFINDIKVNPHFFILAIMMEHPRLYALKTNEIPFYVFKYALEFLPKNKPHNLLALAKVTQDRIVEIFEEHNLHDIDFALRFYYTIQYINNHLDGDASNIWKDSTTAIQLLDRIMQLPYMYKEKAEKIVLYLKHIYKETKF